MNLKKKQIKIRIKENTISNTKLYLNGVHFLSRIFGLFKNHKFVFWGIILIFSGVMFYSGYDIGFQSDELDLNAYGKANVKFYTSFGKDTTFKAPSLNDGTTMAPTLKYYGPINEYLIIGLLKLTNQYDKYEIHVRHFYYQLVSIIGLIFVGLITARLRNYGASIIAICILYFTPSFFILSSWNAKDTLFMSAYSIAIFSFIKYMEVFPTVKKKWAFILLISLYYLFSNRIGGIIIIPILGVYVIFKAFTLFTTHKKQVVQFLLLFGIISLGALLLTILTWPYLLVSPLDHLKETITAVNHFKQRIPVTFDGEYVDSLHLPEYYLPIMFLYTVPIPILAILFFSLRFFLLKKSKNDPKLILVFALFLIPFAYAMYSKLNVYQGWRHLLFTYSPLTIFSAIHLNIFLQNTKKIFLKFGILSTLCIGLLPSVLFSIKNHPYQSIYYNELAGGFEEAYYSNEIDGSIASKECVEYLIKNTSIGKGKDSSILLTNTFSCIHYQLKKLHPDLKIKLVLSGVKGISMCKWDYAIFNVLFIRPYFMKHFFPLPYTVHTENVNNMPISFALATNMPKLDYYALEALTQSKFELADSFYNEYMKVQPLTEPIYEFRLALKIGLGKYDEAAKIARELLNKNPQNQTAIHYSGIIKKGKY